MATDAFGSMGQILTIADNISIAIGAQSEEETFWGVLFGIFTDKYGIKWMVNYDEEQQK